MQIQNIWATFILNVNDQVMAKGRILVFLRVSTEAQELDNQRNEMRDFVNSMGYSDIIYVEGIGASAIKINDEYIEMYAEVRKHIENGDISAVAVHGSLFKVAVITF